MGAGTARHGGQAEALDTVSVITDRHKKPTISGRARLSKLANAKSRYSLKVGAKYITDASSSSKQISWAPSFN